MNCIVHVSCVVVRLIERLDEHCFDVHVYLVGSRFANQTFRLLAGYLGAAFGSFAVSVSVATLFVLMVAYFFPFPIANIVVAFSPGAQDTMMVLALALHLDPVYVAAHHVARFVVTAFSIALAARAIAREEKR